MEAYVLDSLDKLVSCNGQRLPGFGVAFLLEGGRAFESKVPRVFEHEAN
jgi:hypothetical protein